MSRTLIYDLPRRYTHRVGAEFFAAVPCKAVELRIHHDKKSVIAITLRGAFWIRKGKRAKRISVQS